MMELQTRPMQPPGENIKKQPVHASMFKFVYVTYKGKFPAPHTTKILYVIKTSVLMILGKVTLFVLKIMQTHTNAL
jgi:hypothetical protein